MTKDFKNQDSSEPNIIQIEPFLRGNPLISSQVLPPNEGFCPNFALQTQTHLSTYTGITSRILAPFFKLKANCLNMISITLVIIFGNRSLLPLSCRWLIPKCCSIIYLYFEISHLHDQGQRARFATIAKNNIDIWFRQVLTISGEVLPSQKDFLQRKKEKEHNNCAGSLKQPNNYQTV